MPPFLDIRSVMKPSNPGQTATYIHRKRLP